MRNKILINTPDTSMLGGVAAFYKNLNLKSYSNVDYFFIQHNSDRKFRLKKVFVYPLKFVMFFFKCLHASTVIINPSFERRSILRDSLYVIIAKRIFRRRTIIFWHGWTESFEKQVRKSSLYQFILQKFYGKVDGTIILSKLFRDKLSDLGYAENHNFYVSSVAADDSYLQSFQFQQKYADMKTLRLLFLSRVIAEKGIFRAIEIMNQLINNRGVRNIELIVAGEGDDLDEAKKMVKSLDLEKYISFVGLVENYRKYAILFDSHILLFPTSYGEGMPVCILESMLFSLYILSSLKGGIPDIISDANGSLIDESDCEGYVNKIVELLNNQQLVQTVGTYNHLYSNQHYTSTVIKEKLYSVFNN